MPTEPYKPIIFISYAHLDEPEKPAEGEIKWLSFVTGYLRPAVKHGAVDIWIDRLMRGGDDWDPEIERKLRACDIFILLVSRHSLSSDYIVDKEIAIIRERQTNGEDVRYYPLLLTPTPKIALDAVRDKNLRPRDGKPFSDYPLHERYRHMSEAADEIAEIAGEIAARRSGSPPPRSSTPTSPPIEDREEAEAYITASESLAAWLKGQSREVAVAIGARAALRVLPSYVRSVPRVPRQTIERQYSGEFCALFRANAVTRVATRFPHSVDKFRASGAFAASALAVSAISENYGKTYREAWGFTVAEAVRAGAAPLVAALRAVEAASSEGYFEAGMEAGFSPDPVSYSAAAIEAATDNAQAHADGGKSFWAAISADARRVAASDCPALLDDPLWPSALPEWYAADWAELRNELPTDEFWDVWFDWYGERQRGGSRGEGYELVFASVPLDIWDKGPAAANAWIREHLPKGPGTASPSEIARLQSRGVDVRSQAERKDAELDEKYQGILRARTLLQVQIDAIETEVAEIAVKLDASDYSVLVPVPTSIPGEVSDQLEFLSASGRHSGLTIY